MRLALPLVLLSTAVAPALAQLPAVAPTALPAPPPASVSQSLQPALTQLSGALGSIHPDKWKLSGDAHRRMDDNVSSINGDLQRTLPGLLAAADSAPADLGATLAVSRNVDALYDVLLRVVTTAELSAPEPQTSNLTGSLNTLSDARKSLDERIRSGVAARDQQLVGLQSALAQTRAALASVPAPVTRVETRTTPHTAAKPKPKPKPKTATPPPATTPQQ